MKNGNKPANPVNIDYQSFVEIAKDNGAASSGAPDYDSYRTGLTKREYFVAMAMQGLCAYSVDSSYGPAEIPSDAISIADKTLKLMEGE